MKTARTSRTLLVTAAAAVILSMTLSGAVCQVSEEYKIKAAFLAKFVLFVYWPDPSEPLRPFTFCVLGKNPFGKSLEPVEKETVNGRKARVTYVSEWPGRPVEADVVFVSRSEGRNLSRIIGAMKRLPVLTVSDIRGFAEKGGMIEFVKSQGAIHFVINTGAAKTAGLRINFQLLAMADRVIE